MAVEPTNPAAGAAAKRRAPSVLRSLSRWLLSLWWIFIIALGGSVAQYLGNHGGPLLATTIPQLIADVRRYPLWEQAGLALIALTILIIAVALTWLAWVDRTAREAEEADAVIADQKEALGQALDERVVPQLTDLSRQTQEAREQAGEIHEVAVTTEAKVDAVAVVTAETHDVATETRDIAKGIAERQNRPTPLPAGVMLTPVRDIRRETFKLGDDSAANFPYIREPVANAFATATQALRDAAARKGGKRGILVLGEANAGKTRLALESLVEALPDWETLPWSEARQTTDIPPADLFTGRNIALFVDDAQNYAIAAPTGPEGRAGAAIGPGATLRSLWETVQRSATSAVLIATCRSAEEQRLRGAVGWLFTELVTIETPSFTTNARDAAAASVISLFEQAGAAREAKWDGTLGSLVLGLERKHEEFDALVRAHSPAISVLHAMKLLTLAGVSEHTETRVRHVCAEILAEPRLLDVEANWQEAVGELTGRQFVTESAAKNDQLALVIRKDAYFDDVVGDYPDPLRPLHFQQQRQDLRPMFARLADDDALFDIGHSWFDAQDYEEAAKAYSDCVAIRPSWGNAQYNKALALANSKQHDAEATTAWKETLATCEEALRLDPQQADVWDAKGDALIHLERYDEALAAYEEALRLDPQQAVWWDDKGDALFSLKRYDEALAAYEEALRLDPYYVRAWNSKANALGDLNRHEEALAAYEEALRLDPQQAVAWVGKRVALRVMGRWEEALTLYDEALARNPDDAQAWNGRGYALLSLKRYDEAVASIDRALALEPEDSDWWDSRGEILLGAGRYQEALAAYDEALARNPDLESSRQGKAQALQALAQTLHALGREDEAREADEQARALRERKA